MKNNYTNDEERDHSKKIIILIIVVIILLSLITSCGCTSKFFGKMGGSLLDDINNIFKNEDDYDIDDDTNDEETISNHELKFDVDNFEMSLNDPKPKLSFTYKTIKPKNFTCSTSDASIATCYVSDGYVVINPKAVGTVKVILHANANGKVYEASTNVKITEPNDQSNVDGIDSGNNNNNNSGNSNNNNNDNNNSNNTNNNNDKNNNNNNAVDGNNYLRDLIVLNSKYNLDKEFKKNINNYNITVDYNEKHLSFAITLDNKNSKASYVLNGKSIKSLNDLDLTEGDNRLEILVKSKSGKVNTYVINIHKKVRTIKFENSSHTIYLGSSYNVNYVIEEDGKKLNDDKYNTNDIKVSLSQYGNDCVIEINKGYITLKPNDSMGGKSVELNISYNGKTAKTKLNFIKYQLYTYQNRYDMGFSNNHGERIVILNTNLFTSKFVETTISDDKKEINICSNDNDFCVSLKVDNNNDNGNIELEYTGEDYEPFSLPFKIIANSIGKSIIHVSGSAYNNQIANFDIEINVGQKYNVTIDANGGLFNEFTKQYEFQLATDEELDLSLYDEPYKIDEECHLYKFAGYSKTPDGEIIYNRSDKKIIKDLDDNLVLYAIYKEESSPLEEQVIKKTLWLTDVPLFHNEEYYKKYKEDKVIYPGASGVYVMNFKNSSSDKITITGITLNENTICIDGKGCLNMGYIIKYSDVNSNDWTYYYGETDSKYWILHSRPDTIKLSDDQFKSEITFNDSNLIDMEPNDEIAISVFWKWEEVDDDLDTAIGNHAALKITDETINDMYGLSIGVNFETKLESCSN